MSCCPVAHVYLKLPEASQEPARTSTFASPQQPANNSVPLEVRCLFPCRYQCYYHQQVRERVNNNGGKGVNLGGKETCLTIHYLECILRRLVTGESRENALVRTGRELAVIILQQSANRQTQDRPL